MTSSHNFHLESAPIVSFYAGENASALRVQMSDYGDDICIFCWSVDRDKLKRAIEAFNAEMQREPIEHQEAAE
jgi:hypothetical protein